MWLIKAAAPRRRRRPGSSASTTDGDAIGPRRDEAWSNLKTTRRDGSRDPVDDRGQADVGSSRSRRSAGDSDSTRSRRVSISGSTVLRGEDGLKPLDEKGIEAIEVLTVGDQVSLCEPVLLASRRSCP